MTDDRWRETLDRIAARFPVRERGDEPLPEYPNGKREFIVFEGPMGRIRLERITKPRTIGQRVLGSRRIGASARVEAQYDLQDLVHFIQALRWEDATGTWVSIDAAAFS